MGILITGVNGFIGHYLANKFLSKNIEVYGVYRNNIPQIRNKNFFKVNINNKNFSIPKNISTIFHLAAESPGKYNNKNFNDEYLSEKGETDKIVTLTADKDKYLNTIDASDYRDYDGEKIDKNMVDDILGFLYESERYSLYLYLIRIILFS